MDNTSKQPNAKRRALGKGLSALMTPSVGISSFEDMPSHGSSAPALNNITPIVQVQESPLRNVNLFSVFPNATQPRKWFDEQALAELSDSIKKDGLIQPIIVRPHPTKADSYEIIAGERRWRAATLAELKEIPVIVRDVGNQEVMELALVENIQRRDLNPIEEAEAYRFLNEEYHLSHQAIAEKVGKSRVSITLGIKLTTLPDYIKSLVISGDLTEKHARALSALDDSPEEMQKAADYIIKNNIPSYKAEALIRNWKKRVPSAVEKQSHQNKVVERDDLERRLRSIFGTKVDLQIRNSGKGKVVISFFSREELEGLFEMFQENN